jgi:hypothetical protein
MALRNMPAFPDCDEIAFHVEHGPRNEPARQWLRGFLDRCDADPPVPALLPSRRLLDFAAPDGVTLIVE